MAAAKGLVLTDEQKELLDAVLATSQFKDPNHQELAAQIRKKLNA